MELLKDTLQRLRLGAETTFEKLTMYPLLNGGAGSLDYLTLRQALEQGTLRITEVSEGGSVAGTTARRTSPTRATRCTPRRGPGTWAP